MNLNRIGNWAADGYSSRKRRIEFFLDQTSGYLKSISTSHGLGSFEKTFTKFLKDYRNLEAEGKSGLKDELLWAEKMMTWGNILTHRAKLL